MRYMERVRANREKYINGTASKHGHISHQYRSRGNRWPYLLEGAEERGYPTRAGPNDKYSAFSGGT
jgi:hypothetical protein